PPEGVAGVPGGDPARDQPGDEHLRAGDRPPHSAPRGRKTGVISGGNPLTVVTARSRRRRLRARVMEGLASVAALLAIAMLLAVIYSVARRGAPALTVDFFTKVAAPFGQQNGGIKNAIFGTLIMTGIATAMSVPVGVLIAIYNTEFAPKRVAQAVRMTLNVLAGVPTIVIGVFIYGLLVVGRGQSAFSASVAL